MIFFPAEKASAIKIKAPETKKVKAIKLFYVHV
jgi:hypothetical protein